jgi:hypothetical protein
MILLLFAFSYRDQALHLLTERAVLTRALCRELRDSGGVFNGMRPLTALALLSRWIKNTFPETEPLGWAATEWLDDMVVPEGCEDLMREVSDGAEVCEALLMLVSVSRCIAWSLFTSSGFEDATSLIDFPPLKSQFLLPLHL